MLHNTRTGHCAGRARHDDGLDGDFNQDEWQWEVVREDNADDSDDGEFMPQPQINFVIDDDDDEDNSDSEWSGEWDPDNEDDPSTAAEEPIDDDTENTEENED